MFAVSEPVANLLFNWSNILVAVGAALGLLGVVGIFAMGAAKEQFSNERISANEAAVALAHTEAAVANARAAEANLALEKIRSPRQLTAEQQDKLVELLKLSAGTPFVVSMRDTPEAKHLLLQLNSVLDRAGWVPKKWQGSGDLALTFPNRPPAGINSLVGVFVQADSTHSADFGPIATKFAAALRDSGIEARSEVGNMQALDKAAINIQIGEKPN